MEKFVQAVKASLGAKGKTSVGVVTEITGDTCTVKREGLPELLDVRLNAVSGKFKNTFIVFPKIGSEVLVLEVENAPAETSIVKWTEIDRVQIKIEQFEFDADDSGIKLSNQGENFKSVYNDMIDEVNKILVIQGNTINVGAMNDIRNRFNKIFK
nr:hypothetical protein BACY1_08810 [Tenacibaculum mesophilum]